MWKQPAFWTQYQIERFKGWFLPSSCRHFVQQFKIARLLKFSKKQLPFYQDFSNRCFEQLPIIDKATMQDNFESMNTLGMSYVSARDMRNHYKGWFANQSVGTSGQPGIYLFSAMEKRHELASLLSKMLTTSGFLSQKVAVLHLRHSPYFADIRTRCFKWRFLIYSHKQKMCYKMSICFLPMLLWRLYKPYVHLRIYKTKIK